MRKGLASFTAIISFFGVQIFGSSPLLAGAVGFILDGNTTTFISPPGSTDVNADGLNAQGQVVGSYFIAGGQSFGFIYTGGNITTLSPPGSTNAFAKAINASGQVVGTSSNVATYPVQSAFLYGGGNFTTVVGEVGSYGSPTPAINSSGQIVGDGGSYGFLYSAGNYTVIAPPGSAGAAADAINDAGQIVGSYSSGGTSHGFLYDNGTYTTIDPPGSILTNPTGINNLGQIVGFYATSTGAQHGFIYSGGIYTTLDFPGADSTDAFGINNLGEVVGVYSEPNLVQGFLYNSDGFTPIIEGYATAPVAINDSGVIVGRTFLDVAGGVPEPSTWAMMILGFCGIGFVAYRRKNGLGTSSLTSPVKAIERPPSGGGYGSRMTLNGSTVGSVSV